MLAFGMAENRKRLPVTLTLDPDIRARVQQVLENMPGKPSLSQLVDELLDEFTTTMGPVFERLKEATGSADPAELMRRVLGDQMLELGAEAGKINEALKSLPQGPLPDPIDWTAGTKAARALREARKRKE